MKLKNGRISILIVLVLIICLASEVGFAAAASGYQDEFTGSSLQPFWTFVNPKSDCSYSLVSHSGWLRITAPYSSSWTHVLSGTNLYAPRILQPVTGDFVATTCVTGSFSSQKNFAGGLLLWVNDNNFVRLEARGDGYVMMYVYTGTLVSHQSIQFTFPTDPIYLKLEKSGSTVKGYYSFNGADWTPIDPMTFNSPDAVQVGLLVINAGVGLSDFSADFDYFHILPNDVFVVPEYSLAIIGAPVAMFSAFVVFSLFKRRKVIST